MAEIPCESRCYLAFTSLHFDCFERFVICGVESVFLSISVAIDNCDHDGDNDDDDRTTDWLIWRGLVFLMLVVCSYNKNNITNNHIFHRIMLFIWTLTSKCGMFAYNLIAVAHTIWLSKSHVVCCEHALKGKYAAANAKGDNKSIKMWMEAVLCLVVQSCFVFFVVAAVLYRVTCNCCSYNTV